MSIPVLRKEVQDYLSSCESLMSAGANSDSDWLTDHEVELIKHLSREVTKMAVLIDN